MKTSLRKPRDIHASYQIHRRQLWTQILLPVLSASLAIVAVVLLACLAIFGQGVDASRWAEISTIWLIIPAMVGGLIMVLVLGATIYLLTKTIGLIPGYSYRAQALFHEIEINSSRAAEMVRKPVLAIRALVEMIKMRLKRTRERK